ncbi:MAG TPA: hypothetical protein PLP19_06140 [bacterium]|nr:hypothetical protein [bacterium]HPN43048.1 hypothetical protein [bacterium]
MKKWTLMILLFSVAVNISVIGTLIYFWKKNALPTDDIMWMTKKEPGMNKSIVVFKSEDIKTMSADLDSITEKRMVWADTMHCLCQDIESDRQAIIHLMLNKPPQRDSINFYIHSIGAKQIKAESLTVDHLIGIRELMPERDWEELVKSLGSPRRVMVHREFKVDDQKATTIEIKEMGSDIIKNK